VLTRALVRALCLAKQCASVGCYVWVVMSVYGVRLVHTSSRALTLAFDFSFPSLGFHRDSLRVLERLGCSYQSCGLRGSCTVR